MGRPQEPKPKIKKIRDLLIAALILILIADVIIYLDKRKITEKEILHYVKKTHGVEAEIIGTREGKNLFDYFLRDKESDVDFMIVIDQYLSNTIQRDDYKLELLKAVNTEKVVCHNA